MPQLFNELGLFTERAHQHCKREAKPGQHEPGEQYLADVFGRVDPANSQKENGQNSELHGDTSRFKQQARRKNINYLHIAVIHKRQVGSYRSNTAGWHVPP